LTCASIILATCTTAALAAPGFSSKARTRMPSCAANLHDPAPHGTGANHRDQEIGSMGIEGHVVSASAAARPVY
jgi:hypothetical protein